MRQKSPGKGRKNGPRAGKAPAVLAIVQVKPRAPAGSLAERRPDLADAAEEYARNSLSDATQRATKADWKVWSEWCAVQGVSSLPATIETAAAFFADQAKSKKVATLHRYRATVGKLHKLKGYPSPFADVRVKAVFEGIQRTNGIEQHRKSPVNLLLIGSSQVSVRDRAVLLLGLATSFRGKELCSLNVSDLTFDSRGIEVHLRKSKTDQKGVGRVVGVPLLEDDSDMCPTRAVKAWIAELPTGDGPLFRGFLRNGKISTHRLGRRTVNTIVKSMATAAGLNPDNFGAHSLRAGYVTEARMSGQDWTTIMSQTGHKKIETVQRYDRGTIDPFKASKVADVFKHASIKKEGDLK